MSGLATIDVPRAMHELKRSGIMIVDKPVGWTSMDVCRVVRRITGAKKVGHGGTLDPFATGVLPIMINRSTKLSAAVMNGEKEYEGIFIVGETYDTQDVTGVRIGEPKTASLNWDLDFYQNELQNFVGKIMQKPPMYSAIKKNGQPLYEYARAGQTVEVEAREVLVESIKVLKVEHEPKTRVHFRIRCGKGVYVRTIVHDLGERLGVGAVLESLRRMMTGPFHIDEAVPLGTLKMSSDVEAHLRPVENEEELGRLWNRREATANYGQLYQTEAL